MTKRINKVIELWEEGQPVYHEHPEELSYEAGLEGAKTLADMFLIDFDQVENDLFHRFSSWFPKPAFLSIP